MKRILSIVLPSLLGLSLLLAACSTQTVVTEVPAHPTAISSGSNAQGETHDVGHPGGSTIKVTLADDGSTIQMQAGQQLLLALGNHYNWTVQVDDPLVLRRVTNIMVVRGAQGVYNAIQAGSTGLTATSGPLCPPNVACPTPQKVFHVTIVVKSHLSKNS